MIGEQGHLCALETMTAPATHGCQAPDPITRDKRQGQQYRKCQSEGIMAADRHGLQVCKTIRYASRACEGAARLAIMIAHIIVFVLRQCLS